MKTDQVNGRYLVDDVDTSVEFYTKHLGFTLGTNSAPAFAEIGNLRSLLSGRKSSAGRAMPDGHCLFLVDGIVLNLWQEICLQKLRN